jgi:hypothetical protein
VDDKPETVAPLELITSQDAAYCDPETGECIVPAAASADVNSSSQSGHLT